MLDRGSSWTSRPRAYTQGPALGFTVRSEPTRRRWLVPRMHRWSASSSSSGDFGTTSTRPTSGTPAIHSWRVHRVLSATRHPLTPAMTGRGSPALAVRGGCGTALDEQQRGEGAIPRPPQPLAPGSNDLPLPGRLCRVHRNTMRHIKGRLEDPVLLSVVGHRVALARAGPLRSADVAELEVVGQDLQQAR